jgi:ATP-dependent Clp protease adaptor protein ClpS
LAIEMGERRAPQHAPESAGLVEVERRLERPKRFLVLLHNDDYTTMEFVVDVLQRIFHHPTAEATRIMLDVHHSGIGVAGVYPRDVAETKATQVTEEARTRGMPLLVTTEPDPASAGGA